MFIGHFAVGFASKQLAPRASLGILIAAPILLDFLWPIFLLIGWEHAFIESNPNPLLRFVFISYPISHGLVAVAGWATLLAAVYYGFQRYALGAIVIWAGVVSHWLLDFIVHRPDLPLYAGSKLVGLGLWRHREVAVAIELAMFAAGIFLYFRQTTARDKIGTYALRGFIGLLLAVYALAAFGPAPRGLKAVAIGNICGFLVLVAWAWWIDAHRQVREPGAAAQQKQQFTNAGG
jgi:hypothetical protein